MAALTKGGPARLGATERWMFGPGRAYDLAGLRLDGEAALSCLAEFRGGVGSAPFDPATALPTGPGASHRPRVPVLFRGGSFGPHVVPVVLQPTGTAPVDATSIAALLGDMAAAAGHEAAQMRLNFPLMASTLDAAYPAASAPTDGPAPGVDGSAPLVIVAVIDAGIPFAHQAFRHHGHSRVDFCWSQCAPAAGDGAVLFGREFRRSQIDTLIRDHSGDEDAIYRAAGLLGGPGQPPMPLARLQSHGAHILGTAAGDWDGDTAARVRVIAVDLPATAIWETSGFGTDMVMVAALHYIFDRADRIAATYGRATLPLVINISYGFSGGAHDGAALLDRAMDELIAARRAEAATALILPSGNMFQDALHAQITGADFEGEVAALDWVVQPDDATSNYLELWYPPGTPADDVVVDLHSPMGAVTRQGDDLMIGAVVVGQLVVEAGAQTCASIILAPTAPRHAAPLPHGAAPAGIWQVRLSRPKGMTDTAPKRGAERAAPGLIQARIQRDTEVDQGNTGARQSYFRDAAASYAATGAPREDDPADARLFRFGGLNGMATGKTCLIVAGHDAATGRAARYSSTGSHPDVADGARAVDLSAPTERSATLPGIRSIGTRSGVTIAQSGTSSAAPQAARALAAVWLSTPPAAGPAPDNYRSHLANSPGADPVQPTDATPRGRTRLGHLRLPLQV